ncbi:lectin [Phreatobacter sp.]|uniref:lectin n=1 Tax=Phreatobacter sp. TaxID=1966341 RepID=UPI003525A111
MAARLGMALMGVGALVCLAGPAAAQQAPMGFFITSAPLDGGNLGGLAGADRHCQTLAAAAGAGNRTWRAYLSTQGAGAVNARDRIGAGPWANARGVVIAASVAELHGTNNLTKQTALTEAGAVVNGRGDTPNQHDILTGSQADGTAFAGDADRTCGNWTKNGEGSAMVGHHDRMGLNTEPPALSWNTSHGSRGCDMPSLRATGGDGRIYCFAAN